MKRLFLVAIVSFFAFGVHAQTPNQWGETPEDSLFCLEKVNLFRMHYEAKNYREAYDNWQMVVNTCPRSWDAIFTYSQNMLDNLIKEETDSIAKRRLIDTLFWTYDVRSTYFPKRFSVGSCIGFKALNMLRYNADELQADQTKYKDIFKMFEQSVELDKENTQPSIWNNYFLLAGAMVEFESDTTIIIEAYERATTYIKIGMTEQYKRFDQQVAKLEELQEKFNEQLVDPGEYSRVYPILVRDTARINNFIATYEKTLTNIEQKFTPYAPCEVLKEVYGKKMDEMRDNVDALKRMLLLFQNSKDCLKDNALFEEAIAILYKNDPSADAAFWMGNFLIQRDNKTSEDYEKILSYYNEALGKYETNEQKSTVQYMIGTVYFLQQKFVESRAAALEAIKLKPNNGQAYMLIGDLYSQSGSRCSGGDNLPYAYNWAAADKYLRAATVDPSLSEAAAQKRNSLTFPSKDAKFERGLNTGDTYRVGCWINETTTVR